MAEPHQLDRIEEMLSRLTANLPNTNTHMRRHDVALLVIDMLAYMISGRKIEAIKTHRQLTGMGLKESKDAIENIMDRFVGREAA